MDTKRAKRLFDEKMREHGLARRGWTARYDNARRRFGVCTPLLKEISISQHLVALNDEDEVLDTILHEIAHALAYETHGDGVGHDARWQAICRRIGARPERTFDATEAQTVTGSWYLVHRETAEVFASYDRRPSRLDPAKTWIRGRRAETEGKLALVSARDLERHRAGEVRLSEGATTLTSFDRESVKVLADRVARALAEVGAELGVEITLQGGRFNAASYDGRFTVRVPDAHVEAGDRAEFALHCALFGLTPDDFGRTFVVNGTRLSLCGVKPRNRKYPIIGLGADGKRYKCPRSVLDGLR